MLSADRSDIGHAPAMNNKMRPQSSACRARDRRFSNPLHVLSNTSLPRAKSSGFVSVGACFSTSPHHVSASNDETASIASSRSKYGTLSAGPRSPQSASWTAYLRSQWCLDRVSVSAKEPASPAAAPPRLHGIASVAAPPRPVSTE